MRALPETEIFTLPFFKYIIDLSSYSVFGRGLSRCLNWLNDVHERNGHTTVILTGAVFSQLKKSILFTPLADHTLMSIFTSKMGVWV